MRFAGANVCIGCQNGACQSNSAGGFYHSADSGTQSSPNIGRKLCNAGFQLWMAFPFFAAIRVTRSRAFSAASSPEKMRRLPVYLRATLFGDSIALKLYGEQVEVALPVANRVRNLFENERLVRFDRSFHSMPLRGSDPLDSTSSLCPYGARREIGVVRSPAHIRAGILVIKTHEHHPAGLKIV